MGRASRGEAHAGPLVVVVWSQACHDGQIGCGGEIQPNGQTSVWDVVEAESGCVKLGNGVVWWWLSCLFLKCAWPCGFC